MARRRLVRVSFYFNAPCMPRNERFRFRYVDICDVHGVYERAFYYARDRTLDALEKGLAGEISFPRTDAQRAATAAKFALNSNGILDGCLSALDGFAVPMFEPSKYDCENPSSYKNRKGFFAILVQAMCDADALFTWAALEFQGSCHDSTAFTSTPFFHDIDTHVPGGYYIAADDAYVCSEKVLTPYSGSHDHHAPEDTFNPNYYHSSTNRIIVECAFGRLVRRWGILWRPLQNSLKHNTQVISVCMLLHNYCTRRGYLEARACREPKETDIAATPIMIAHEQNDLQTQREPGRRRDVEVSKRRTALKNTLHASGMRRRSS